MEKQADQQQIRLGKLNKIRDLGTEPYPYSFQRSHTIPDIIEQAEELLKKQEQWYTFYYWHAKVLTALDVTDAAIEDWKRVLNAPAGMASQAWREEAKQALAHLLTPSPTPTKLALPSPTATP